MYNAGEIEFVTCYYVFSPDARWNRPSMYFGYKSVQQKKKEAVSMGIISSVVGEKGYCTVPLQGLVEASPPF